MTSANRSAEELVESFDEFLRREADDVSKTQDRQDCDWPETVHVQQQVQGGGGCPGDAGPEEGEGQQGGGGEERRRCTRSDRPGDITADDITASTC